jgi:hypothetical protein
MKDGIAKGIIYAMTAGGLGMWLYLIARGVL